MHPDSGMLGLRKEFGLPYENRYEFGSIDAPNAIPAGSCYKYNEESGTDWVFQSTIFVRD